MTKSPRTTPAIRWRALIVILLIAVAALAWVWLFSGQIRQMQMILSYATVLLLAPVLLTWLLFFSRLPWRMRLLPVAIVVGALVLGLSLLRFRGLTGDWLPVVEWRWQDRPEWSKGATGPLENPAEETEIDLSSPAAFPRFLGPHGNSTVTGMLLARDWQQHPPELRWKRDIGSGWSGFAIAGGSAFTLEQRDDEETLVVYDLETGEERWSHGEESFFTNPMAGPGPRSTPTLSVNHVFTYGARGLLSAFDGSNGELIWQHDVIAEHDARLPEHGQSGSPLIVDDLVVVSAGAGDGHSLVAYQQEDGALAWHAGDGRAAYGSPSLATLAGERQILVFNAANVAGHSPLDGRVLWKHAWPPDWPNVAPPVVIQPDRIMFSTGYGIGAKMLQVIRDAAGGLEARILWESPRLKAKFSNLVLHDGFIYGLDDGVLVCLDPETGERRWKRGRYGHGSLLLIEDVLLVQTEKGDMVMLEPTPEEHRELTRFTALRGKAWNHFAVVEPYLLVRNDREAALWKLPLREAEGRGTGDS